MSEGSKVVKKTVAIHPIMDRYIRMTWSILIEGGHDATYSTALNYMLLIAIMEAAKKGGLQESTLDTIRSFVDDPLTIAQLNLEDHLSRLRKLYRVSAEQ